MRMLVLALTLAMLAQPLSAAPDRSRKQIDIPAQTLSSALERLARECGLQIVYLSEKTDALQTAGATGGTPGSPTPVDGSLLSTRCTWDPGLSASAQARTRPGNPPPDPRSTQRRA